MNPLPPSFQLDDEHIEALLKQLPQYDFSSQLDNKVFAGIGRLAVQKRERAAYKVPAGGFSLFKKYIFATGTTFLVLLGGTTAFSYQDSVTYGSPLYGLKRGAEKIELAIASDPVDEVNAQIRFSNRRMAELDNLLSNTSRNSAFLITTAYATGTSPLQFDVKMTSNITRTVNDMRTAVKRATTIVESNELAVIDVENSLAALQQASDDHVTKLQTYSNEASTEISTTLSNAADNEENQLSVIVEALDEAREARKNNIAKVKVHLETPLIARAQRLQEAEETIAEMRQYADVFNEIAPNEREAITSDINNAEHAIQQGKVGIGLGLSRVAKKRIFAKPELLKVISLKTNTTIMKAPETVQLPRINFSVRNQGPAYTPNQTPSVQVIPNYSGNNGAPAVAAPSLATPIIERPTVYPEYSAPKPQNSSLPTAIYIVPQYRFVVPEGPTITQPTPIIKPINVPSINVNTGAGTGTGITIPGGKNVNTITPPNLLGR